MFYAPEVFMVVAATLLENHCSIIVNNEVTGSVLFLFVLRYVGRIGDVLRRDICLHYYFAEAFNHQGLENDGLSRDRVIFCCDKKTLARFWIDLLLLCSTNTTAYSLA